MSGASSKRKKVLYFLWACVLAALTVLRTAVMVIFPYQAATTYGYDHALMVKLAVSLSRGEWLGSFTFKTLCKNISYPLFLAAAHNLHLPYGAAYAFVIVISSVVFCLAVRPWVSGPFNLGLCYLFMLFCPVGLSNSISLNVYRNTLVPWTAMILLSCVVALYIRAGVPMKKLAGWVILECLTLPFFWYLREDSLWILPFLCAGSVLAVVRRIRLQRHAGRRRALHACITFSIVLFLPFVSLFAFGQYQKHMNAEKYGVSLTNTRTGGSFAKMMDLLHHIDPGDTKEGEDCWLTWKAMEMAEDASPTLKSISGDIERKWKDWSSGSGTIRGDIPVWALLEAGQDADYAGIGKGKKEGERFELFYEKAADELEEAFENGTLPSRGGIYLSAQIGPLDTGRLAADAKISAGVIHRIDRYYYSVSLIRTALGKEEDVEKWEEFLGIRSIRADGTMAAGSPEEEANEALKSRSEKLIGMINKVITVYQFAARFLCLGAVLGILFMLWEIVAGKNARIFLPPLLVSAGLLLTEWVYVYMVTIFSVWLDSSRTGLVEAYYNYSSGAYILIQMTEVISIAFLVKALKDLRKTGRKRKEQLP